MSYLLRMFYIFRLLIIFPGTVFSAHSSVQKEDHAPYLVYLKSHFNPCVGVLIKNNWVLAPAHCYLPWVLGKPPRHRPEAAVTHSTSVVLKWRQLSLPGYMWQSLKIFSVCHNALRGCCALGIYLANRVHGKEATEHPTVHRPALKQSPSSKCP